MGKKESVSSPACLLSSLCLTSLSILTPLLVSSPSASATGGGPGRPGVVPAGPDQRSGGNEQVLCPDDERSHL